MAVFWSAAGAGRRKGRNYRRTDPGGLVIVDSWPGQARTIFRDHARFAQTYFSTYPGTYFTGDGCRRDEDHYYWITGRIDDVINVSGHRLGTGEIENALVAHPKVAEAAVVGYPHDLKGQGIYCYVTLNAGETPSEELKKELVSHVRKEIGPIASPDLMQFAPGLPKTRSGKIMRRILRKIAEDDFLISATLQHWPSRPLSTISSTIGRTTPIRRQGLTRPDFDLKLGRQPQLCRRDASL